MLGGKKLDGIGPVDKGPSTNDLHHFVNKKKRSRKNYTWHLTPDMWQVVGVNILWKFHFPSSYGLEEKGHWLTEWLN